ncbi:APC family permease [Rhizobium lusitanum]|uniref:APC family permease n=1 Tax=Rhizobium lusitanum TaxID=293958 RepID=UPI001959FCDA|nr:APC family permease [Rhizobium lusitanum]MBM7048400.1 APC family permease [Rhizobium lusitanum]
MTISENASPPSGRLAKNSVGVMHIVFFVVAAAAPLTAVVGATPPAFAFGNGAGVPGAFVLAGLLYLTFAVGFTAMSRHVGDAGAFYTYITHGIGKPFGVGGAFVALLTYSAVQIAIYGLIGVFAQGAMAGLGVNFPWWVWSFAVLLIVHFAGQRNIAFSGAILGVCMLAEIGILLLLDVGIVLHGGGPEGMSLSTFAPSTIFAPGLGVALVFVLASFIGFEATAIFGEEAENPEKTIPRATYISVLLIAVFYALSTWAITQYYGPSKVQAAASAALETFYFDAATNILGAWSAQVMNILLISSLFACILSFHNTLNRYFFALGREGIAFKMLGKVHTVHGSPYVAGWLQSISAAVILAAFIIAGQDPYAVVFSYMSALAVLGILAVQVLVSVAVIMFFRRDNKGYSIWTTTLAPAISLVGLAGGIILVTANLSLLAGTSNIVVSSFPFLVLAVGLLGIGFALKVKSSDLERYAALGKAFE